MIISFSNNINDIGKKRWNSITGTENPFLRFEFLSALEAHDCVGKNQGWIPQHLIIEDLAGGEILGLMPLYLMVNWFLIGPGLMLIIKLVGNITPNLSVLFLIPPLQASDYL